jgi:hypothetical protein
LAGVSDAEVATIPARWELLPATKDGGQAAPAAKLRPLETQDAPRGYRHATGLIQRAMEFLLFCNMSLRAAARAFEVLDPQTAPTFWTLRHWVLRLGLYELQRAKPVAADWIFIVDATIAVGEHKALVILGARLGPLQERSFNLRHQDVVTLGLKILPRCNGEAVHAQLQEVARKVGVPRAVVSDGGADVAKGVRLLRRDHPEVAWIYDLTHRLARLLEKQLKGAEWWARFVTRTGQVRNGCRQTKWCFLLPPAPRTKARWFNLDPAVNWGLQALAYGRREGFEDKKFAALFGWLEEFEPHLQEARQLTGLIKAVCEIIKASGINAQNTHRCRQKIEEIAQTPGARTFGARVMEFLDAQTALAKPGETLLGASDVIESVFGKYKSVVERSPLKVITEMVLTIAALTSARTSQVVQAALETVSLEKVKAWFGANGRPSPLTKRKEALGRKPTKTGITTA